MSQLRQYEGAGIIIWIETQCYSCAQTLRGKAKKDIKYYRWPVNKGTEDWQSQN